MGFNHKEVLFKSGSPDYELFNKKLEVIKSASLISNSSLLYIRDYYTDSYPFFYSPSTTLTGYSNEELDCMGNNAYFTLLSESDLLFLKKFESKIFELIYSLERERREYFVLSVTHNLKHKDGYLVPANVYITPFLLDNDGYMWMTMARLTFGKKQKQNNHFLYVDLSDSSERYLLDVDKEDFVLVQRPTLTHMEKNVLILAVKGYLEKEVAQLLNVSINTIKTHKKNILRKLDAENISEASILADLNRLY